MRISAIIICALLLGACGTSYKVAPTTAKVTTKLATAKRTVQHVKKQTAEIETRTQETKNEAAATGKHIDAALKAIGAGDYVTATQELILAKVSNDVVQMMLEQSYRNVKSLGESLQTTENDLTEAEAEVETVKREIEKMAIQGAKDRAIVEQGEWLFGFGYFIVGFKRLLCHALWGTLILVGIVIAMLAVGGPTALFAMRGIRWLSGLWKKRKPD